LFPHIEIEPGPRGGIPHAFWFEDDLSLRYE
jgi:hypothetical protein